jgi:RNA polymerase sigma-70 factor (ECF subfamily)
VLVLHEIEQMTAPEIARTLELPLNTVYSRLRVARVELDAALARLSSADTARDAEEAAR